MLTEKIIEELRSNICPEALCMELNRRAADALERLHAFTEEISQLEQYGYPTRLDAVIKINQLIIMANVLVKKEWW